MIDILLCPGKVVLAVLKFKQFIKSVLFLRFTASKSEKYPEKYYDSDIRFGFEPNNLNVIYRLFLRL